MAKGIMIDIDYLMWLLDWDSSKEDQEKGRVLARKIRCVSFSFLQSGRSPYGGPFNCPVGRIAQKEGKISKVEAAASAAGLGLLRKGGVYDFNWHFAGTM